MIFALCLSVSALPSCSGTKTKIVFIDNFCEKYVSLNFHREEANLLTINDEVIKDEYGEDIIIATLLYEFTTDTILENELNWEASCKK